MNSKHNLSKLALGTVQFGLPYGVVNLSGQVAPNEVNRILTLARDNGITTLDTAIAYGESEKVLGSQCLDQMSVITKLPEVPSDCSDVSEWLTLQFHGSLERIGVESLDSLLLHRPSQLLEVYGAELYRQMQALKRQGLVKRVGISIYGPEELDVLCELYQFDVIQAPFNILDRRLIESGWLERLHSKGTAIHVRSVFMQGLLLASKEKRPKKFSRWDSLWDQWDEWLQETGQTPVAACLRYVAEIPEIEKVVVGVDSYSHLEEIIRAFNGPSFKPPKSLYSNDYQLLNPYNWNNL